MLPILQVGPLAIPVAPFSLLIAFWFGLSLAEKFAPKHGISAELLYNLAFTGLITGIIGARLGYVLQYPNAFIQAPLSLISFNLGLFDNLSGFSAAFIGMLIFVQRAKLGIWKTLDALTPLLASMAIGLAIAHLASGEAFGAETSLPWGLELWGAKRHPSQVYELLAGCIILVLLIFYGKTDHPAGRIFIVFIALSAGTRLFLEAFRGDSSILAGSLRTAQVLAWVILAAALARLELGKQTENEHG